MKTTPVNPNSWEAPKGYNNGMMISGSRMLCIAGQIAWNEQAQLVGEGDFPAQFNQALRNVASVVEAAGGTVEQIGKLTIYVTDKQAYIEGLKTIGEGYREVFGKHFPAMALIEVKGLLEPGAMVEIEALAFLP